MLNNHDTALLRGGEQDGGAERLLCVVVLSTFCWLPVLSKSMTHTYKQAQSKTRNTRTASIHTLKLFPNSHQRHAQTW